MDKYGIVLRLVEVEDAEFIVKLRTDEQLGRFLSATSTDVDAQREWIDNYKEREYMGNEFYFIVLKDGVKYGTTRIYNIEDDCFEIGSWLFHKNSPPGISILADILARDFAFEKLKCSKCKFEVRKQNLTVVKYHKGYKPILLGEDDLNYYFILTKQNYEIYKYKLLQILLK